MLLEKRGNVFYPFLGITRPNQDSGGHAIIYNICAIEIIASFYICKKVFNVRSKPARTVNVYIFYRPTTVLQNK